MHRPGLHVEALCPSPEAREVILGGPDIVVGRVGVVAVVVLRLENCVSGSMFTDHREHAYRKVWCFVIYGACALLVPTKKSIGSRWRLESLFDLNGHVVEFLGPFEGLVNDGFRDAMAGEIAEAYVVAYLNHLLSDLKTALWIRPGELAQVDDREGRLGVAVLLCRGHGAADGRLASKFDVCRAVQTVYS